ncbi:MAG: hypothetical protein IKV06_06020 [Alistipes sp.]|nr:hypothetical protein [Alistipes sp.]
MKRFYALLIVALFAITPSLMAQSASFYNATRDAEKMIKQMPTENYHRAYFGINNAHINWKDYSHECEIMYPVKSGITFGYLESYHIVKGLPIFVEYGANLQYLFGKEELSELFAGAFGADYYKTSMFALNIPVNVSMRLSFENNTFAVTPYAGLNFRVNISGKQAIEGEEFEQSINLFNGSDDDGAAGDNAFNRIQTGLNYGIAFSYDVYTISVGRVSDISRIANIKELSFKGRMGVTTISVGYAF